MEGRPARIRSMIAPTALPALLFGYMLGSIPFGLLLSRLAGLGDIRQVGSGNIGATNVLRTGRKDLAAATVLLDGGKGALAVVVAAQWGVFPALIAGFAAVLGHCTSPWVGFKGGKGVATGFGVLLAWAWFVGLICGGVWLAVAFLTRRSSAAALAACIAAPVLMNWLVSPAYGLGALLVSLLVIVRHHGNIRRLMAGKEPRIGAR
jgi:glycerol-3-phosphate acyltransferase PlsY